MVIQLIHFWPTELFQNKSSLGKYVIRGHLPIVLANGKFVNTAFSFIDQVGYIYILGWQFFSETGHRISLVGMCGRGRCINMRHFIVFFLNLIQRS